MSIEGNFADGRGLPPLPTEWQVARLRHVFDFNKGLTITKENLQDEGIPCVNYGEIHSKYGFEVDPDRHPLKCVDASYIKNNQSSLLRRGDFVFADTSEDIEGSGNFTCYNSDRQAFAGYHTLIAKPKAPMNARFMAYLLDSASFRAQVRSAVKGVKVFSISQAILKPTFVWFPPLPEQRAIAGFLDETCARVDEAVRIKQQQIALLRERRQILIQQAVTRGLNPAAPMKDSGIDWLGQIPAHWEVKRIKHVTLLSPTRSFDGVKKNDDEVVFLPMEAISDNGKIEQSQVQPAKNLYAGFTYFRKGDVVIAKITPCFENGKGAVLDELHSEYGFGTTELHVLRPSKIILAKFLFNYLNRKTFREHGAQFMTGSAGQQRVPLSFIANYEIGLPSVEEQREIVAHIDEASRKIEDTISIKEQQIAALREYKASLIDAAVTGKIRVTSALEKNSGVEAGLDRVLSEQA